MIVQERGATLAILGLALFSGILAIGNEVLWIRHLLNLFGSTTTATATMLAAFMAGMALGAWAMGRISVAARRPLLIYAGLEVALGAYGLGIGGIVEEAAAILPGGAVYGPGGLPITLPVRGLGYLVILLLPTTLMGATLPALAAALQFHGGTSSGYLATLYGLNVLGGVAGAFGTGFLTLPSYGLSQSQNLLSIMAVLAAATAMVIGRITPSRQSLPRSVEIWTLPDSSQVASIALRAALFLSGFAALGYEILWTRILVLVIGSSTYAFSLMLGTYLLGLALGSLWIGRHIDRLRAPVVALQHLQLAVAFAAVAGTILFRYLPQFMLAAVASLGTSPAAVVTINASVAAAIVLVPTFLIGAAFPIAARLMQRGPPLRGREIGSALAWVSGGHVVGVLATAFAIVPLAGLQDGIATVATFNVAAALCLWMAAREPLPSVRFVVPIAIIAITGLAWAAPAWNAYLMTSGIYRNAPAYLNLLGSWRNLERAFAQYRSRYYREGNESVVAVFERPTLTERPHLVMTIDGKVDASTGADMSTQILSGYLPALFRPDMRNALVIGLASGVTVGALAQSPLERIDVVEIEAAVVDASRVFDVESHAPLEDPRVRIVIEDGRQFLRAGSESYDAIVSEPSNPWLSSSSRLFTREFFELVRGRLSSKGIFVQWTPLYGLGPIQFQALLRTLLDVFPYAAVFRVAEGDLVVVASLNPLALDLDALDTFFDKATSRVDFLRANVRTPAQLVALWIADHEGLRSVLGEGRLNTDDNGLLEFGSPWYLLRDTKQANLLFLEEAAKRTTLAAQFAISVRGDGEVLRFLMNVGREHVFAGRIVLARNIAEAMAGEYGEAPSKMLLGEIAFAQGDFATARRLWENLDGEEAWSRSASAALRQGEFDISADFFARAPMDLLTPERRLEYGIALIGLGRIGDAQEVLDGAIGRDFTPASVLAPLLRNYLGSPSRASVNSNPHDRAFTDALTKFRRCLEREGCQEEFDRLIVWIDDLSRSIPSPVLERLYHDLRTRIIRPIAVYHRAVRHLWLGDHDAAKDAFDRYLELVPNGDPASKAHELVAVAERWTQ